MRRLVAVLGAILVVGATATAGADPTNGCQTASTCTYRAGGEGSYVAAGAEGWTIEIKHPGEFTWTKVNSSAPSGPLMTKGGDEVRATVGKICVPEDYYGCSYHFVGVIWAHDG